VVTTGPRRDLVIGVTPFQVPNPQLAAALVRGGALGVLDLGRDAARARTALAQMSRWAKEPWGVRVPVGCLLGPDEIPAGATTILLPSESSWHPAHLAGRRVLVEVTDPKEAQRALAHKADGLIARGSEGGGRIGELTTYVLLQQLLIDPTITVPVWAAGGLGRHSASAAIAGGAAGVVLDAQLALLRESLVPKEIAAAISAMDGSETMVIGGHRVYSRPDLAARRAHWPELAGVSELSESVVAARLGGESFDEQFIPIGQDGAFARSFAEEYGSAGALVQGLRASIAKHLGDAAAAQSLSADSSFARGTGSHDARQRSRSVRRTGCGGRWLAIPCAGADGRPGCAAPARGDGSSTRYAPLGRWHPGLRAGAYPRGAGRGDPQIPAAVRADCRRSALAGGAARSGGNRHLHARPLAGPTRPLPARRCAEVRLRGTRVWWPRWTTLQLRVVGCASRNPTSVWRKPSCGGPATVPP
jgi:Nitronate monooxygenase